MKYRRLSALVALFLVCALGVGCGVNLDSTQESAAAQPPDTAEPLDYSAPPPPPADYSAPPPPPPSALPDPNVDIDLTALSSTMVYAEVYDIMQNPDNYVGKSIKINGTYTSSFLPETDTLYHFVLIADALACCQQGFEFRMNDQTMVDYPAADDYIEVIGVMGKYEAEDGSFFYVAAEEMNRL